MTFTGTASLAQVHRAVLHSGEIVAVKVQHNNVRMHSLIDIASIDALVRTVARIFPEFSFQWLANEMRINLPLELDFLNEGRNCERVQQMFHKFPWFSTPKVYWQMSTSSVLTMDYVEGAHINDKEYIEKNKIDVRMLTKRLSKLYSDMIFVQGFVHCDPHPGNILIRQSSNGPEIILLDHGLYSVS
jgi:aarF domain-containing kinase